MSHVISSQPSSTSPYKPTETEIVDPEYGNRNSDFTPRITGDTRNQRRDCCCYVREDDSCCLQVMCAIFGGCCQTIGDCTESCLEGCARCICGNCCEDKPRESKRYKVYNYTDAAFSDDAAAMDNSWLVGFTSGENGVDTNTFCHDRNDDCRDTSGGETKDCYVDNGCNSGGGDTGCCDSGGGDTGCCDSGGGGGDSGGGCDSGGGGAGGDCD